MGYVIVMGFCFGCKRAISYNPHKVPSITVEGRREAICQQCAEIVQENQVEAGLPVQDIAVDAYAAIREDEL